MCTASCLKSTTVASDLESSSVLTLSSFPDVGCWIRSQRSQRDQCGGRQVIKKVWIKPSALLLGNRNDESLQSQNASCGTPGSRATVRDWATTNICYAQVKFLKKKKKKWKKQQRTETICRYSTQQQDKSVLGKYESKRSQKQVCMCLSDADDVQYTVQWSLLSFFCPNQQYFQGTMKKCKWANPHYLEAGICELWHFC